MRKEYFFTVLIVVFVIVLNACGGKDEESKANAASSEPQAAEPVAAVEGDPVAGEAIYQSTCVACHGPDAKGVQGLGKSLHPSDSEFIQEKSNEELVAFIKQGRQPDDPLNTTGVAMPPKGGNPALSDEDIQNVVAYMRTLE